MYQGIRWDFFWKTIAMVRKVILLSKQEEDPQTVQYSYVSWQAYLVERHGREKEGEVTIVEQTK